MAFASCLACFFAHKHAAARKVQRVVRRRMRKRTVAVVAIQCAQRARVARAQRAGECAWRVRLAFARALACARAEEHACAVILQRALARRAVRLVAQCAAILDDRLQPAAPLADRVQTLTEEHVSLESALHCVVCWKRRRTMVFSPCMHVATCTECAERLNDVCCICRSEIATSMSVYLV